MAGEESDKPPDVGKCRHYWVIEPANGPVSPGLCQICGQTGVFKNYITGPWDSTRPKVAHRLDEAERYEFYPDGQPDDREIALVC